MNQPVAAGFIMLASLAILGGCTTMGTGQGDVSRNHQPGAPVHFTWKSTDGGQGECHLSDGRTINATFDPS